MIYDNQKGVITFGNPAGICFYVKKFNPMERMKAVVCMNYGGPDVLQLKEVEKPVPGSDELLIRISTVVVGIEDPMQRKGKPYLGRVFFGLTKPGKPILGTEFCGEIEEVGKDVRLFNKGDKVFGVTGASFGCYAEYMCMPETGLVLPKPICMTEEEAAPVCGTLAAWSLLKVIARIRSGQTVLIYGASGSIGSAAIQIARLSGAEVTGVCRSDYRELVRSLGADHFIDSTKEDFTKKGLTYDILLDVSGKPSRLPFKNLLNKGGFYLTVYPTISILFQMLWTSIFRGKKVVFSATALKPVSLRLAMLRELVELFKEGKLKTIVDQCFQLEQMAEVHRYVEEKFENGLEKGNVIVKI